jgi:protein TonB
MGTSSLMAAVVAMVACVGMAIYWHPSAQVYELGGEVTAPVPIASPRPQYTAAARRAKIQGTVRIECIVRLDGRCSNGAIVRSLDRTFGLDDGALRTIAHWRFRPAVLEGRPVATHVMLDFHFGLR